MGVCGLLLKTVTNQNGAILYLKTGGNSPDMLRHIRWSVAYSVELIVLNKRHLRWWSLSGLLPNCEC